MCWALWFYCHFYNSTQLRICEMTALQDFFDEKLKLPSPPLIAFNILNAVRKDEESFDQLAEIIQADPALTARVLKIANSSLYATQNPIDSLPRAIALIGTQALKNIALSFVIVQKFQDAPQGSFDLNLFWRRAISNAVSAEILAEQLGYKDHNIFVSALLQDIGVLVMFLSDSAAFTQVLDNKRISGKSLSESEKEQFGFDHTEVGAHLLTNWNLSDTICEPIRYHHNPNPEEPYKLASQILNFSDKISSMYHGIQSNKKSIEVRDGLKQLYQFEDEQTASIIDTIGERAREVMDLFSIKPGEMKPFSQIMQEANDELGRLNLSYEQIVLELKQAKQNAEQLARDLKQANDSLRELAFRDELSGLYNHRYFQEVFESELNRALRYKHPLSLMLLDIDYFKKINDHYGHLIGDEVIKGISSLMVDLVRHCDIVARYGGEEFAILLPETAMTGAKVLAQRVRRGVEQHLFQHEGETLSVTISIGLASTEMDHLEMNKTALLSHSDKALYRAKRNGRNRVAF